MKNKGVFITILLILILGMGTTVSIHGFISQKRFSFFTTDLRATSSELLVRATEEKARTETEINIGENAAQGEISDTQLTDEILEALTETGLAEPQQKMGRSRMIRRENSLNEHGEYTELFAETEKDESADQLTTAANGPSVLTDAPSGEAGYYLLEELITKKDFQQKLKETDQSMEELRKSGSALTTTDSMKMTADYEYRLWDTELNRIYQAVLAQMSKNEAELFQSEERAWIRNRDRTARQAAEKFSGGTMESLEYTASLTTSTRSRAYDILEQYGDLLP